MVTLSPSHSVILNAAKDLPGRSRAGTLLTVILSPSRAVILSPSLAVILSEAKNLFGRSRAGSAKDLNSGSKVGPAKEDA